MCKLSVNASARKRASADKLNKLIQTSSNGTMSDAEASIAGQAWLGCMQVLERVKRRRILEQKQTQAVSTKQSNTNNIFYEISNDTK